jgi:hypothetical protein
VSLGSGAVSMRGATVLDGEGLKMKTTLAGSVIDACMWRKHLSRMHAFVHGRRNSPRAPACGWLAEGHGLGRGGGRLGRPWW